MANDQSVLTTVAIDGRLFAPLVNEIQAIGTESFLDNIDAQVFELSSYKVVGWETNDRQGNLLLSLVWT